MLNGNFNHLNTTSVLVVENSKSNSAW